MRLNARVSNHRACAHFARSRKPKWEFWSKVQRPRAKPARSSAPGVWIDAPRFSRASRRSRKPRNHDIRRCLLPSGSNEAVKNLSDQEFRVIELRYGLATGYECSLEEVGRDLGITPERGGRDRSWGRREIEGGRKNVIETLDTDRVPQPFRRPPLADLCLRRRRRDCLF